MNCIDRFVGKDTSKVSLIHTTPHGSSESNMDDKFIEEFERRLNEQGEGVDVTRGR